MPAFKGFSKEAVAFFRELRQNNDREWFQPRKEIYETEIKAVMEDLASDINHELGKFAPAYIAEPKKAVFRIYRDTRFSHDKTPYKTNIAASFPRQGMEKNAAAGFYFSVSDEEVEIAGGLYMPDKDGLLGIRTHIAQNLSRFTKIVKEKKLVGLVGPLQGESLMRVPKGFDPADPAADFIRMKQWIFFQILNGPKWMQSPGLLKEVASRFKLVAPLVDFLNEPLVKAAKRVSASEMMR